jgi:predicted acyltransferase
MAGPGRERRASALTSPRRDFPSPISSAPSSPPSASAPRAGPPARQSQGRIESLDQFRGYTVAGMFFVNYAGGFAAIPAVLKHHNTYCSYADTIMPHFLFAVGFALRLVVLRNRDRRGARATWLRALRRIAVLAVIGVVFYHLSFDDRRWDGLFRPQWGPWTAASFWRESFQTLVHIAVTSLWVLPVIAAPAIPRLLFGAGSGLLHLALSAWFWYSLLHEKRVIDGGPLGFLTWTIPTLAGAYAFDCRRDLGPERSLRPLVRWGVSLMILGYALSCLSAGGHLAAPPFFPPRAPVDLWTMSQRAGSLSYLTFAAGFSLALYAGFVWCCDLRRWHSRLFGILGANALAGYLIHSLVDVPFSFARDRNAPLWLALVWTAAFIAVSTFFVWLLNRRGWFLRV